MKKLMVVGVDNFSSRLSGFEQWVRGQVVEVSDDDADYYLELTYVDALGNEHTLFKEANEDAPVGTATQEGETSKPVTRRQRKVS